MMTAESLLLTAVSTVTAALCYVCKLLWAEVTECKQDRAALRSEIHKSEDEIVLIREKHANLEGRLTAYLNCPGEQCPFKSHQPKP